MLGKVVNLLKEEPFYVPAILLKNYRKLNITDTELVLLIYLIKAHNIKLVLDLHGARKERDFDAILSRKDSDGNKHRTQHESSANK